MADLDGKTQEEIRQLASYIDIKGRTKMSPAKLKREVEKAIEKADKALDKEPDKAPSDQATSALPGDENAPGDKPRPIAEPAGQEGQDAESRLTAMESRVAALEAKVNVIDDRTIGSTRIG